MRSAVERVLARARARHAGLVVGVSRGGEPIRIWHRGDLRAGPDSIFEIGSVTKLFTATLLADMARAGLVGLNDPVSLHLPPGVSMRSRGREITLADLASHRSGLPRLPPGLLPRALTRERADPYARWDSRRLEAAVRRTRPRRPPERRFRYSNYGFGLLGHLLARRSGMSYDELVRRRICAPLGLHATGTDVDGGRLAAGHKRGGRDVPHWHLAALAGAGGLRSNARDLLGFLALHTARSGGPLARAAHDTQRPHARAGRLSVGLGWLIAPPTRRVPHELFFHEGGTGGFRSFAAVAPDPALAVVVLANEARAVGPLGLRLVAAALPGRAR